MKAMIFAAGLGSRLRPLTDNLPKALVNVGGKPMLQRTLEHLKQYNFKDIIINVHHHADQITDFIKKSDFGLNIFFSDESHELLDTGGGLKKASCFFDDGKPFLVINSDIISNLDLSELYYCHLKNESLATLVIRERPSGRCFLFDKDLRLCGWENKKTGERIIKLRHKYLTGYPFSGIHVINPEIFYETIETGKFSIVDVYLRLASQHKINGYLDNGSIWFDIGDVEKLKIAERSISQI